MTDVPSSVLVIDDSEVDRELVRRYVADLFSVVEASTAREGRALASSLEPCCVLLDYRLPDADGLNLLKALCDRGHVVIVLTGQGDEGIAVRALKGGASDYLVKRDLTRESLRRAIRFALREHDYRRERVKLTAERDALVASERELLSILENTPDLVMAMTPDGIIRHINPSGLRLLDWPADGSVEGMDFMNLVGPDEVVRLRERVLPQLSTERVWKGRIEFHSRSGETIPTDSVMVAELDEDGTPLHLAAICRDVRERDKLEEQLRQSQKMEAIGRLAGGVAHDFNNALTAIFSFSEFAMESLQPGHSAIDDMKEVVQAARRAEGLTKQLLAFSRKRTIEPRMLNPNEPLGEIRRMLERLIGEDVSLVTSYTAKGIVCVDPTALEQVVVNLVVNARDAMPTGGVITIETSDSVVDADHARARGEVVIPGSYVVISVSDTGMGIDSATREYIFEPFFTTKELGKGTGLGLSTVYGIVKQAGGYIFVYSEKGAGTTFRIYLPAAADEQADCATEAVVRAATGNESVLVVEDQPQILRVAERVLTGLGYRTITAGSGEEALEIAKERDHIDLLVTDVVMPKMSGRRVADALVSIFPALKVLFMSGYTPDAIVHHGVVDEGVTLLQKPFSKEQLASKVREVLESDVTYLASRGLRRRTVLVVDDDPSILGSIRRLLMNDFNVVVASSGAAALEAVKSSPPDIILCDYVMPGMDGRQLYEAVEKHNPALAENFVFMTGVGGESLLEFVHSVGRQVLHKPLHADELLSLLDG